MHDASLYAGIISGTSMDGVDCAILSLDAHGLKLITSTTARYPEQLRSRLFDVCARPEISLSDFGQLDIEVGKVFAATINQLLAAHKIDPLLIKAVGSHGQTLFHLPSGPHPFSLQIGDPNTIAQLTGITTVADFRRRDMAAGGQGAPLAPLFHQHFFFREDIRRCILNIGGISNITWLADKAGATPVGFDTGPGNVLMDLWTTRWLNQPYDKNGEWAAQGKVDQTLLMQLSDEPYLSLPSPKSTGRELFNANWLEARLKNFGNLAPADVQRTLLEFTAGSITEALTNSRPADSPSKGAIATELLVCGGGAHNGLLMSRLQELMPDLTVSSTAKHGMHPDWIEASTFAWLASRTLNREKIDTAALTGAQQPVILGGIYF